LPNVQLFVWFGAGAPIWGGEESLLSSGALHLFWPVKVLPADMASQTFGHTIENQQNIENRKA